MTALHAALSTLGATEFASVPQDQDGLTTYLQAAFGSAKTIIDSVPIPTPAEITSGRPRSKTLSSEASASSELTTSSARSELLDPDNEALRKEWGKPLKMNAKDNPLDISTYKLAGKDGKGAWFARRSVHEGMSFQRWKLGLEKEFPETLKVQGGPGEGSIRGIGSDRRVESREIDGLGKQEVHYLTAQFPGPSAARDFVTLLLTSSTALEDVPGSNTKDRSAPLAANPRHLPRHFMVISRPCVHPDCPPKSGFVRGQYESVEFIREIERKPVKSSSAIDVTLPDHARDPVLEPALKRNATQEAPSSASQSEQDPSNSSETPNSRRRSKTTSHITFKERRPEDSVSDGQEFEDEELNPVEWIMITRSDPGGNVPRFLVERGTPGSIVADAGKFVDWAATKEHLELATDPPSGSVSERSRPSNVSGTNRSATKHGMVDATDLDEIEEKEGENEEHQTVEDLSSVSKGDSGSLVSSIANMAVSSLEGYAPQAVVDRLPGHQPKTSDVETVKPDEHGTESGGMRSQTSSRSSSPTASFVSFSSIEDPAHDRVSVTSPDSQSKQSAKENTTLYEKELAKHNERKRSLDERLAKAKEKQMKDKATMNAKDEDRIKKAEEKHAKEVAKQEERYAKNLAKYEAKKKKSEEKDERTRLGREKEDLKAQLDNVRRERDVLEEQVRALQRENTSLVARLGKVDENKDLINQVKADVLEGTRSRSSSLRRLRPATPEKVREATVTSKESSLKDNVTTVE